MAKEPIFSKERQQSCQVFLANPEGLNIKMHTLYLNSFYPSPCRCAVYDCIRLQSFLSFFLTSFRYHSTSTWLMHCRNWTFCCCCSCDYRYMTILYCLNVVEMFQKTLWFDIFCPRNATLKTYLSHQKMRQNSRTAIWVLKNFSGG